MFARRAQVASSLGGALRVFTRFWSCASRRPADTHEQARHAEIVNAATHGLDVWMIDDSIDILAHIAVWHKTIEQYRGYVLCIDEEERVFLVDTHSWRYVQANPAQLLMVEGIATAKALVDSFCLPLHG